MAICCGMRETFECEVHGKMVDTIQTVDSLTPYRVKGFRPPWWAFWREPEEWTSFLESGSFHCAECHGPGGVVGTAYPERAEVLRPSPVHPIEVPGR